MIQVDERVGVRVREGRMRHFKYGGQLDPEHYGNAWFNYPTDGMRPLRFVSEESFQVESVDIVGEGYDLKLRKENSTTGTQWSMRHPEDAQELLEATSSSAPEDLVGKKLKVYIKDQIHVIGIGVKD